MKENFIYLDKEMFREMLKLNNKYIGFCYKDKVEELKSICPEVVIVEYDDKYDIVALDNDKKCAELNNKLNKECVFYYKESIPNFLETKLKKVCITR